MPRFKVAYSPESLQEIKRIVDHYNALSKGLGARFKKNLLAENKTLLPGLSAMMRFDLPL